MLQKTTNTTVGVRNPCPSSQHLPRFVFVYYRPRMLACLHYFLLTTPLIMMLNRAAQDLLEFIESVFAR